MAHFRTVCQHDRLLTQCRCIGPKTTKLEDCKNMAHNELPIVHQIPGGPEPYIGKHRKPGTTTQRTRGA